MANSWIVFDPSREELEGFLKKNLPSAIKRSSGIPWICVRGPHPREVKDEDTIGLQKAWRELQASHRPINYGTVTGLAKAHNCLSGKWLFYFSGIDVDDAWAKVARAVVEGQCGLTAKVSTRESDGRNHVICVYNRDFTDQVAIREMDASIRRAGIRCKMMYKPDAFTYLGIYANNKWKLKPVIYRSAYNDTLNKSEVTAVYS